MAAILVVDDDRTERAVLAATLQRKGHTVETATDGRSAIRLLADPGFDILVTDIFMPVMDGLELIAWVRKSGLKCRIVATSGGSATFDSCFLGAATRFGADVVLPKPVDRAALIDAVDRLEAMPGSAVPLFGSGVDEAPSL